MQMIHPRFFLFLNTALHVTGNVICSNPVCPVGGSFNFPSFQQSGSQGAVKYILVKTYI